MNAPFRDRDRLASSLPPAFIPASGLTSYTQTFPYQSYLSSALYETALLNAPAGQQIIPSTLDDSQVQMRGGVFGLHPSSETPVAVQFMSEAGKAGPIFILRPGDTVRPTASGFRGFVWGLPFGWLGGGLARAVIAPQVDSTIHWNENAGDFLFHRLRLPVRAAGAVIATQPNANLPLRFPWKAAQFGTLQQFGTPSLVIAPTKTLLRLRFIGASATIRFLFFAPDVFVDNATLTANLCQGYVDVTFPSTVAPLASLTVNGVATTTTEFPIIALDDYAAKIGGDAALVLPVDLNTVTGACDIDIFRYGKLG